MGFNRTAWDKDKRRFYGLNLMRSTDGDIIDWLESQPNKQATIKEALRLAMSRQGDKPTPSEDSQQG